MNNTKPWWQSKTAWAAIVAVLAGLLNFSGLDLDAKLQDEIVSLITAAAEVLAGVIAFIGRVQAQAKLSWRQA